MSVAIRPCEFVHRHMLCHMLRWSELQFGFQTVQLPLRMFGVRPLSKSKLFTSCWSRYKCGHHRTVSSASVSVKFLDRKERRPVFLSTVNCRKCSNAALDFSTKLQDFRKIESWSNVVHPYGHVTVKGRFNVHIETINPHEHPEMNVAFVTLFAPKDTALNEVGNCDVNLAGQGKMLTVNGPARSKTPLECILQLPIKFGISVELEDDGNVTVSNLESPELKIRTESGHSVLNNIRAGYVSVESNSGNISCNKCLQGNVDLRTGSYGVISADKLQGLNIKAVTDRGGIQIKSLYSDSAVLWSSTGPLYLGSCHGNTFVDIFRADMSVGSLEGDLTTHITDCGSVKAFLIRHQKVNIKVGKGDITLKLPETSHTNVDITGETIVVDKYFSASDLKEENKKTQTVITGVLRSAASEGEDTSSSIKLFTYKGKITLECSDWLSAFKNSQSWKM